MTLLPQTSIDIWKLPLNLIQMLKHLDLHKIFFLDIETVPLYPALFRRCFSVGTDSTLLKKLPIKERDDFTAEDFYGRAGIWAEFGKIVCISVGYFAPQA